MESFIGIVIQLIKYIYIQPLIQALWYILYFFLQEDRTASVL